MIDIEQDLYKLVVAQPSTWSLRAWLVLKLADIKFEVFPVTINQLKDKVAMANHSPTGLVPVLHIGEYFVHDSLAIAEFANDLKPDRHLWPTDILERAKSRSLASELHSGFTNIRELMPFFIGEPKSAPMNKIKKELDRLILIWSQANGNFYFQEPGVIDAFYAVMAVRLHSYSIRLEGKAGDYQNALLDWPLLKQGMEELKTW